MNDTKKNPEVKVREEGQHPEWALEAQTEGLDEVPVELQDVEVSESEEEVTEA